MKNDNTHQSSAGGTAPALGLATGSLLSWAPRDAESLRGFLPQQPGTTLFIIEDADDEENRVHLLGAIVPDEEEMEIWHINDAKAAAEQYLREWLRTVAAPLVCGETADRAARWQGRAESIAKERGELFRAGEQMRIRLRRGIDDAQVAAWDAAAQPIRAMICGLSANKADIPTCPES